MAQSKKSRSAALRPVLPSSCGSCWVRALQIRAHCAQAADPGEIDETMYVLPIPVVVGSTRETCRSLQKTLLTDLNVGPPWASTLAGNSSTATALLSDLFVVRWSVICQTIREDKKEIREIIDGEGFTREESAVVFCR